MSVWNNPQSPMQMQWQNYTLYISNYDYRAELWPPDAPGGRYVSDNIPLKLPNGNLQVMASRVHQVTPKPIIEATKLWLEMQPDIDWPNFMDAVLKD